MKPDIGNHIEFYTPRRRKKRMTWALRHAALEGKKRTKHGGRGRKYGIKGARRQKKTNIQALLDKLEAKNRK